MVFLSIFNPQQDLDKIVGALKQLIDDGELSLTSGKLSVVDPIRRLGEESELLRSIKQKFNEKKCSSLQECLQQTFDEIKTSEVAQSSVKDIFSQAVGNATVTIDKRLEENQQELAKAQKALKQCTEKHDQLVRFLGSHASQGATILTEIKKKLTSAWETCQNKSDGDIQTCLSDAFEKIDYDKKFKEPIDHIRRELEVKSGEEVIAKFDEHINECKVLGDLHDSLVNFLTSAKDPQTDTSDAIEILTMVRNDLDG